MHIRYFGSEIATQAERLSRSKQYTKVGGMARTAQLFLSTLHRKSPFFLPNRQNEYKSRQFRTETAWAVKAWRSMKMAGVCALRTLLIAHTYEASADGTDYTTVDNHDAKECDLDINADQYLDQIHAHFCIMNNA